MVHQSLEPYKGTTIRVASEGIDTHWYEATVLKLKRLANNRINLVHEITGEDDVVKKFKFICKRN